MTSRNGFVSNSSSSSFIIGLPKVPESAAELEQMLWPGGGVLSGYASDISTDVAAKILFEELGQADDMEEIVDSVASNVTTVPRPKYDKNETEEQLRVRHDAYDAAILVEAEKLTGKLFGEYPGRVWFTVEHSDHSDYGSTMEHGEVYYNVPHIRVSHH